jgi:uncharacterized protein YbbC (DUF1343 family)
VSLVRSGLEVFLSQGAREARGRRVGLIANAASVDGTYTSAVRLFQENPSVQLTALFGPEHGLFGGAQDMIAVSGERELATGLPVQSLYGDSVESLVPSDAALESVDVLVADLQDVGSRYYTFAATIALALKAIARRGGRLIALDRPNPIGGTAIEGPGISSAMRSFVGAFDVPVRHGLTVGELLLLQARAEGLEDALSVIPMQGWSRSMFFEETGLPWIPPSPNMPTVDTAFVYPGACLVEGTNLSEGRGTTRPFEWIGAPFLDPEKMVSLLKEEKLAGVAFRPHTFMPAFHKWAGRACGGVAIHVVDRRTFQPVRTGIAILLAARRLAPSSFAWRTEPYEFVSDRPAIDLLTGGSRVRERIEAGSRLREIVEPFKSEESAFSETRSQALIYL